MHRQYLLHMRKLCARTSEQNLVKQEEMELKTSWLAPMLVQYCDRLVALALKMRFAMQSGSAQNEQRRDKLKQHASTIQTSEHTSHGGIGPRRFLSARGPGVEPGAGVQHAPRFMVVSMREALLSLRRELCIEIRYKHVSLWVREGRGS